MNVVVDGRFLTMTLTGVQRYAHQLLEHLPAHVDGRTVVAVPPDRLIDAGGEQLEALDDGASWHGPRGHLWEQLQLPRMARRIDGAVVFSPASWGPVAVRRQVVLIHDLLPFTHGAYFTRSYRTMARVLTPAMIKRGIRIAATCDNVRDSIAEHYRMPAADVDVIPPGVGEPFASWPTADLDSRTASYCLMVGAHDRRKNLAFLLGWWPEVHRATGLELVITTRGSSTVRFADEIGDVPGVRTVVGPSDTDLAELYAGALCLLWPSLGEGFGLPLLEAMAVGTPFLSTDVGAASNLAVEPGQVLPLDRARWIDQIRAWHLDGITELRKASVERSRTYTWDASAAAAADSLSRAADALTP